MPDDHSDTRDFLVENWENAVKSHKLSNSEEKLSEIYTSSRSFQEYVSREQNEARRHGVPWKINLLSNAVQLARHLALFESMLDDLITGVTKADENDDDFTEVKVVNASPLWQLAFLNVKVCLVRSQTSYLANESNSSQVHLPPNSN